MTPRRPRPTPYAPRLETLEARDVPAPIAWVCGDGDWATPECWDLGRLPEADDDVTIAAGDDVTVTHSAGITSVRSLESDGPFVLAGGSLTLAEASALSADFAQAGGRLAGAGDLFVGGPFTWTAGEQVGTG